MDKNEIIKALGGFSIEDLEQIKRYVQMEIDDRTTDYYPSIQELKKSPTIKVILGNNPNIQSPIDEDYFPDHCVCSSIHPVTEDGYCSNCGNLV